MLLKLRGGLDSFFVTILLGLLIGAFAIFGIGPNMLSGSNQHIASVGGTDIPTNRYYAQVQSRAQTLQAQFGGQFTTPEIIRMMRIDEQILQQMLVDAAITEHMSLLGMRASDALVRKELEGIEGFLLPDGTLSQEMIQQALVTNNITEGDFLDDVRNGVSRRQLLQSLLPESALPRYFAEKLYTWEAERRRATMINLPADSITDIATPTEEEIASFYEDNKSGYMAPERRSYGYIMVTPAQFTDKIEISDEDIQEEYDSRLSQYQKAEKRGLQQVNFSDKVAADTFIAAIEGGADFAEAGAAVSDFTLEEIDLGEFTKDDVESTYDMATADSIFSLDEGGVTPALEAFSGYSVFRTKTIIAATIQTLEDVREELLAEFKEDEAIELMYDFLPEFEEALADDLNLSSIVSNSIVAEKLALSVATVTDVTSRGETAAGTSAVTSQEEYSILSKAFQLEAGADPELTDIDPTDANKGVYLVVVNDVTASSQRPLEEVRSDVISAWTTRAKQNKAGELAETAKERLLAGDEPELIAEELGGTSFNARNVVRTGTENTSLSANIRQLIFDTPNGDISFERAADGNGYVVVRIDEITPGDAQANSAAVDTRLADLNTRMTEDIFAQYQAYLQSAYPPEINRILMQQLFTDNTQQP